MLNRTVRAGLLFVFLLFTAMSTAADATAGAFGTITSVDAKGVVTVSLWGKSPAETVTSPTSEETAILINQNAGKVADLKEGMWIKIDELTANGVAKKISAGQFLTKDGDKVEMFKGLPEEFFLISNSKGWYTNEVDGMKFKAQQMGGSPGVTNTGMNFRAAAYKEPAGGFVIYMPLTLKDAVLNHGGPKPGSMKPDEQGRVFINKDTVTEQYWKHFKNPAKPDAGFTTGLTELTMRKFPKREK